MSALARRWIVPILRFWRDFLIGDTPEITLGVLALVGAAFVARLDRVAALVIVPVLCSVLLATSTWRGRRRTR